MPNDYKTHQVDRWTNLSKLEDSLYKKIRGKSE